MDNMTRCGLPGRLLLLLVICNGLFSLAWSDDEVCETDSCRPLKLDESPDITSLQELVKKNGQKIRIIDEIGDFKSLYICLLEPANNERLRQLVIQCQLMSGSCIIDVLFNEWLMGRGANPVTWRTLISKLRCTGMIVLADTIEQEMEENYPSQTIYLEKVQTCSRLISNEEHIQELKNKKLGIYQNQSDYSNVIDFISSIKYCIVEELIKANLSSQNYTTQLTSYKNELDEVTKKLQAGNICAGVFGVVKVGKSTFLNALLGDAFLPSTKQAETAKRVRIFHDCSGEHVNGTLFHSMGKNKVTEVAKGSADIQSLLESINDAERRNGSSAYKQLIIRAPFLFLKNKGIKVALELSDTPGMNEAGTVYPNYTERAIEEMVAYIIILPVNALNTDGNLKIFQTLELAYPSIFKNLNRVFILVNDYDHTYKHMSQRSLKAHEIPKHVTDYLRKPQILGKILSEDNVLPISALWALRARQWKADPNLLLLDEKGSIVYEEAINILRYAGNDEVNSLKTFTYENVKNVSEILFSFSKIEDVEEKIYKMLNEKSELILYESVLDGTQSIAKGIGREINTIIKNIDEEKVAAEATSFKSTVEKFKDILSKLKEHLRPTTFAVGALDDPIIVTVQTMIQGLFDNIKRKVDYMIVELSNKQEKSKRNLQIKIVFIKQSLVKDLKDMVDSELQKIRHFVHGKEIQSLKWLLSTSQKDLYDTTTSCCQKVGDMCNIFGTIKEGFLKVAQVIDRVEFNIEFNFFAEMEIISDESLQSMIKEDTINKFSHDEEKCAGIWFFQDCFNVPVYKPITVYSMNDSEMISAYYALVHQLSLKFSSITRKSVENYFAEVTDVAVTNLDIEFAGVQFDMDNLKENKQEFLKQAKSQTHLLHTKRHELSWLSGKIEEKIKDLLVRYT